VPVGFWSDGVCCQVLVGHRCVLTVNKWVVHPVLDITRQVVGMHGRA